jgi:tetratricopeptide (TPR) repeat protein
MRRTTCALVPLLSLLMSCASGTSPERSETQLRFGVKAARMSLWREARFRFERASRIDPNSATIRNDLAVAYEGAGDFEKARQAYAEALHLDPSNSYIQKNYSRFMEFYNRNRKRAGGAAEPKGKPEKVSPPRPQPFPEPASPLPPPLGVPDPGTPPDVLPPHGSES